MSESKHSDKRMYLDKFKISGIDAYIWSDYDKRQHSLKVYLVTDDKIWIWRGKIIDLKPDTFRKMADEKYIGSVTHALAMQDTNGRFAYELVNSKDRLEMQLQVHMKIEDGPPDTPLVLLAQMKFTDGVDRSRSKASDSSIYRESTMRLMKHLHEWISELRRDLRNIKQSNSSFAEDLKEAQEKASSAAQLKKSSEEDLYDKFLMILNTKKNQIMHLQNENAKIKAELKQLLDEKHEADAKKAEEAARADAASRGFVIDSDSDKEDVVITASKPAAVPKVKLEPRHDSELLRLSQESKRSGGAGAGSGSGAGAGAGSGSAEGGRDRRGERARERERERELKDSIADPSLSLGGTFSNYDSVPPSTYGSGMGAGSGSGSGLHSQGASLRRAGSQSRSRSPVPASPEIKSSGGPASRPASLVFGSGVVPSSVPSSAHGSPRGLGGAASPSGPRVGRTRKRPREVKAEEDAAMAAAGVAVGSVRSGAGAGAGGSARDSRARGRGSMDSKSDSIHSSRSGRGRSSVVAATEPPDSDSPPADSGSGGSQGGRAAKRRRGDSGPIPASPAAMDADGVLENLD